MKNRFPGTLRPLVVLIASTIFGGAAHADNYLGTSEQQGGVSVVGVTSGMPTSTNNMANTQIYSAPNSGIYLLNSSTTYFDLLNPQVNINASSPGVTMAVTREQTTINSFFTNITGTLNTGAIQSSIGGSNFSGSWDFSQADITGLSGMFNPAQVTTSLVGGTTRITNGSGAPNSFDASGYSVDLVTGAATLGATTTNGIANTGDISTTTLTTTGNATVGGALAVTGVTTTNGIANTGDISTATLTTTGNATVGGALAVTGVTTTNGITNIGDISTTTLNTSGLATLNSAAITNNATVGGTLVVTGATTLNGATTVNNSLNVNGATTIVGATSITGTTSIHGATTVVGTTNINTTGTAATTIGNAAAAATLVGNVVSASAGNGGNSGLTLKNGEASMTVTNSLGNTHGLVIGESSTTLSGGTRSTNLTLNDNGATFSNAATGAPTRVTGVANGAGDFDAVNVRQFSSAVAGATATANIPGVDTNKTASVGVGMGSYMNSQALAFGGSYRFSDKGVLRASLATGLNTGGSKTSFGIGAGWSW